ncbi:hypothetical protein AKJ16_DCAP02065 [Drosera capensis]
MKTSPLVTAVEIPAPPFSRSVKRNIRPISSMHFSMSATLNTILRVEKLKLWSKRSDLCGLWSGFDSLTRQDKTQEIIQSH